MALRPRLAQTPACDAGGKAGTSDRALHISLSGTGAARLVCADATRNL